MLEKSRFNKETGAAINSAPNCTKMLEWLGVDVKEYGGTLLEEVRETLFKTMAYKGMLTVFRCVGMIMKGH